MTERSGTSDSPSDDAITDAFVVRLMEHRHRLYAFIAKQLVNPADVEDVFQRTSIVLWKKMGEFDPEGSFFHWACGVAYNEVRNFLTVRRRDRLHFDTELLDLLAAEARDEEVLSQARLNAPACLHLASVRAAAGDLAALLYDGDLDHRDGREPGQESRCALQAACPPARNCSIASDFAWRVKESAHERGGTRKAHH